jgi:putative ABC transport system ATP-binding protein
MNEPDIVLADEPTGNLDERTGEQVLDYLFDIVRRQRRALVLVTHNETVAGKCDRILQLRDGTVAAGA